MLTITEHYNIDTGEILQYTRQELLDKGYIIINKPNFSHDKIKNCYKWQTGWKKSENLRATQGDLFGS